MIVTYKPKIAVHLLLILSYEVYAFPRIPSFDKIFPVDFDSQYNKINFSKLKLRNNSHYDEKFVVQTNLIELAKQLNLTTLVDKLKEAGMTDVLDHEGKFTVFGPTNDAFERTPGYCNNVALKDLMKYHVVRGAYTSKMLKSNKLLPTMLTDRNVRVNMYKSNMVITANGRQILTFDHIASNGVIHILQDVMCALYVGSAIVEINRCPSFSNFSSAVNLTRLYSTLDGPGPFTVFVPSDNAFDKLPPKILHFLKTNLTAFAEVLVYHVVPSVWYSLGFEDKMQLKTLQGSSLTVSVSSEIKVNNAVITLPDATVGNGVVHSIDTVLLPPSFKSREV